MYGEARTRSIFRTAWPLQSVEVATLGLYSVTLTLSSTCKTIRLQINLVLGMMPLVLHATRRTPQDVLRLMGYARSVSPLSTSSRHTLRVRGSMIIRLRPCLTWVTVFRVSFWLFGRDWFVGVWCCFLRTVSVYLYMFKHYKHQVEMATRMCCVRVEYMLWRLKNMYRRLISTYTCVSSPYWIPGPIRDSMPVKRREVDIFVCYFRHRTRWVGPGQWLVQVLNGRRQRRKKND